MSDDPREILQEAGVECHDLTHLNKWSDPSEWDDVILALARLVAKYKWQRDDAVGVWAGANWDDFITPDNAVEIVDILDRRWDEYTPGGEV